MNIPSQSRKFCKTIYVALVAASLILVFTDSSDAAPQVIIFDDFSSNEIGAPTYAYTPGTSWVVDSGTFAANGENIGNFLPVPGQMNVGTSSESKIHIDLGFIENNTPVTVTFFLRQSDGANQYWFGINFGFGNTSTGQTYMGQASPSPVAFVPLGEGTSGFASYDDLGGVTAGAPGATLLPEGGMDSWQTIEMVFNPEFGISVFQNDILVSSWNNYYNLTTVDQFVIENYYGGVSWFIDDFTVIASVPEPSTMMLLGGISLLFMGWKLARRRSFRRAG